MFLNKQTLFFYLKSRDKRKRKDGTTIQFLKEPLNNHAQKAEHYFQRY